MHEAVHTCHVHVVLDGGKECLQPIVCSGIRKISNENLGSNETRKLKRRRRGIADLEDWGLLRLLDYSGRAIFGDWGGLGFGGHDELNGLVSVLWGMNGDELDEPVLGDKLEG